MAKIIDYFDPAVEETLNQNLSFYRRNFIVSPKQWETLAGHHLKLKWEEVKFERANAAALPNVEGLYMFVLSPKKINAGFLNYLFYIGETDSINRRFGNYLAKKTAGPKSGQYKVYRMIKDFPEHLYFVYAEFPGLDQAGRRKIEDEFLTALMPPANGKYPQKLQSIVLGTYGR